MIKFVQFNKIVYFCKKKKTMEQKEIKGRIGVLYPAAYQSTRSRIVPMTKDEELKALEVARNGRRIHKRNFKSVSHRQLL